MSHVLVVDDDPVIADLVAFRLGRLGLEVSVESDGVEQRATGIASDQRAIGLHDVLAKLDDPSQSHHRSASILVSARMTERKDAAEGRRGYGGGRVLAVVQAGGQGSRMDVLTRERAKPALPFAGVFQLVDEDLITMDEALKLVQATIS